MPLADDGHNPHNQLYLLGTAGKRSGRRKETRIRCAAGAEGLSPIPFVSYDFGHL